MSNIIEVKTHNLINKEFDFFRKKKSSLRLVIKNNKLEIIYVLNKNIEGTWNAFCMNELSYKNLSRSIPYYYMIKIGDSFKNRHEALIACNQSDSKKLYLILLNHSFKDNMNFYKQ